MRGASPYLARVGRYRRVVGSLLIRLRFLFPFQPRSLSSGPVAIGRVLWPRVVLARFSSPSRASSSLSCHRMWLARRRERRFRNSGQGHRRENSSRSKPLATPSPPPHTHVAVKSPMPDRKPVSVCTSQPIWNFSSGKHFGRKAWRPRRFFGRCGKRDSLLHPRF